MLKLDSYEYICKSISDIPEQAKPYARVEVLSHLGESISLMFSEFSKAFPLTVMAMEKFWSKPIACFEKRLATGSWLTVLLLEKSNLNLFFDLRSNDYPLYGSEYDNAHAMLPGKWRELYRAFESFGIVEGSVKPMRWCNTPFCYSGRLTIEEYRRRTGSSKSGVQRFVREVGTDQLMCWLLTEAGDALFLDEARCDQKVYHVRDSAFDDVAVLRNPDVVMDRYLAHYVAGRNPAEFDFRA